MTELAHTINSRMFLLQSEAKKRGLIKTQKEWMNLIGANPSIAWNLKNGKQIFTHEQILEAVKLVSGDINWVYGYGSQMLLTNGGQTISDRFKAISDEILEKLKP